MASQARAHRRGISRDENAAWRRLVAHWLRASKAAERRINLPNPGLLSSTQQSRSSISMRLRKFGIDEPRLHQPVAADTKVAGMGSTQPSLP